jgi:diacylglycerol O-acyltransferase / wax synthase
MGERLRPRDLRLLALDSPSTPLSNATVEVFDPGDSGFDHDALVRLISERIAFVPRYRQRLLSVPGRVGTPVWIDDPAFDLHYHVRRSALPRPGTLDQLRELVARIISRPLDRSRPLWEVYFVEGLEDGRVAVLAKSHQILVDGTATVDLGQVLVDTQDTAPDLGPEDDWHPEGRPDAVSLALDALRDNLESPRALVATVRANADSALRLASTTGTRVGGVAAALAGRRPASTGPFHRRLSQQRRFVAVRTELSDHQRIRRLHGGTVNDVVLATITGGLRGWLMTRSESMHGLHRVRAMVPMSVIDDDLEATSLGTQVTGHMVDLPIGEASPVVRLHQVSYALRAHKDTGRAVSARRLAGIAGFAPTTFHALGSRVAAESHRMGFDLAVTNVPGPQFPLYAAGARMLETWPVHPLLPDHALAIGVTSYDGGVYYGITADRDAIEDADVLGQCVTEALEELRDSRQRAPRGRARPGRDQVGGPT